jgi:hypothetical protein
MRRLSTKCKQQGSKMHIVGGLEQMELSQA